MNTSATGGFLSPIRPEPTEDDMMMDAIQATIVGITALPGQLVRPRWQTKPPTQPPAEINWCAVGLISREYLDYPFIRLVNDPCYGIEGELQNQEKMEILATFYGPNDAHYSGRFRDGMYIPQNLEYLATFGIKLVHVSGSTNTPELINNQWVGRTDVDFTMMRQVNRRYPLLNLLSAQGFVQFARANGTEGSAAWKTPVIGD